MPEVLDQAYPGRPAVAVNASDRAATPSKER